MNNKRRRNEMKRNETKRKLQPTEDAIVYWIEYRISNIEYSGQLLGRQVALVSTVARITDALVRGDALASAAANAGSRG